MSTAVAPVRPAGAGSLERELKYLLPAGRAFLARKIVSALCQPDPVYPAATVFTIYYDTPDLTLLSEKLNSDYLKTKVRLRWYLHAAGSRSDGNLPGDQVARRHAQAEGAGRNGAECEEASIPHALDLRPGRYLTWRARLASRCPRASCRRCFCDTSATDMWMRSPEAG